MTADGDLGGLDWDLSLLSAVACGVPLAFSVLLGQAGLSPAVHAPIEMLQLRPGTWQQGRASGKQAPRHGTSHHGNQVRKQVGDDGKRQQSREFSGTDPLPCSLFYGLQSYYK